LEIRLGKWKECDRGVRRKAELAQFRGTQLALRGREGKKAHVPAVLDIYFGAVYCNAANGTGAI
jgi:hypothetical protein